MRRLHWREYLATDPGKLESVRCGYCRSKMTVSRNVMGPTCWTEAMGGGKHLHDWFNCPNWKKDWHIKVANLWHEVDQTSSTTIKKLLMGEISEILRRRG